MHLYSFQRFISFKMLNISAICFAFLLFDFYWHEYSFLNLVLVDLPVLKMALDGPDSLFWFQNTSHAGQKFG